MKKYKNPQIFTSETSAVRGLASLIAAHPEVAGRAFNDAIGKDIIDVVDPKTVSCENKRVDLYMVDISGQEFILEAKIDHSLSSAQIEKYQIAFPDSATLLLVPDVGSLDVHEIRFQHPEVYFLSWSNLLAGFKEVNKISEIIEANVRSIYEQGGTKQKARNVFAKLIMKYQDDAQKSGITLESSSGGGGYPSLDISVSDSFVKGQIEKDRKRSDVLRFQCKIGISFGKSDYESEESKANMNRALTMGWGMSKILEEEEKVRILKNRRDNQVHKDFGLEYPYMARGYKNSYIGVATEFTEDPDEVLGWALILAKAYADASDKVWGKRNSE